MGNKFFLKIYRLIPRRWRWLLDNEGFKRYSANTGWVFLGQFFSLGAAFFVGAWVARYLGPSGYGILSYAVAFVTLFGFVATLGIDSILNRELVKQPEKRDELLGTSFRLKFLGGLIAFALVLLGAWLFPGSYQTKLLIIIFSISLIFQALNVINFYFQAEVKAKNNVKALVAATLISSVLKIVVIWFGWGIVWLMAVYALDSLWQGGGFIIIYRRSGLKIKKWRFDLGLARALLKNSWPLMLATGVGYVYLKIDQVMIGALLDAHRLGIYAAAVKPVEVWYFIPVIFCASLFPALINAKKADPDIYRRRLKNFYVLMIGLSLALAIPIYFLARPLILLLFGRGYLEAVPILQIYIWSNLGLFSGSAAVQYLLAENLVKTIFWLNFLTMAVNIVLNLIFIPRGGLLAAAGVTLISYSILPVVVWLRPGFIKITKRGTTSVSA